MKYGISSMEAYTDWWLHIESMNYTLRKLLESGRTEPLTRLDRERLGAVVEFVRALGQRKELRLSVTPEFLARLDEPEPTFAPDINLRVCFQESTEFAGWLAGSKIGFDKKLVRLADAAEKFANSSASQLFAKDAPQEEFKILKDVTDRLLARSECKSYEHECDCSR